jgi:catechol 2,3-dioxygenase-like lactoylglutathione lyase family enzyme
MEAISHVAIGVSDMDRSLEFYCGLLGLTCNLDTIEKFGDVEENPFTGTFNQRRAAYLRYGEGPHASFLVLSQFNGITESSRLQMHQIGIHHFSFWVTDLRERVKKLEAAGVKFVFPPTESDTIAYGEPTGKKVLTTIFEDPDGTYIQFDQRLN